MLRASRRWLEARRHPSGVLTVVLRLVAFGWIVAGLVGTYSYLQNYSVTRGFVTPVRLARAVPGRLLTVHFYSPSLGRQAGYVVYLPAGYDPGHHRYPVFYLLHGTPGRPVTYINIAHVDIRLDNLIGQGRVKPMIMVFPDGRINGNAYSDSEWANTRSGRFEGYVIDVMHNLDQRFATVPDRQARVIGGLSAGAYGAINIALHNLTDFASVQVWSGYFTQTHSGVFAHATKAQLAYNSPIDYLRTLRSELAAFPLRGFLFVGRDDSSSRQILPMVAALKAAGATVHYAIYPGGHDWQLWHAHLDQMLILASRDMSQAPPARHLRRRRHAALVPPRRAHHLPRRHVGRRSTAAPVRGRRRPGGPPRTRAADGTGGLIGGLILALASAAAINLGFLLQQRGLRERGSVGQGQWRLLRSALKSRSWLAGQALGWLGFAAQIVAVSVAPLSLVQAFAAGGLALSVPMAAGLFGYRISRTQVFAVLIASAGLFVLPIGVHASADRLDTATLLIATAVALAVGLPTARARAPFVRAIAAGLLYGVADAAIKAVSVSWGHHANAALLASWVVLAVIGTFGGFLAFQAALRAGSAITSISLMNGIAALAALGFGLLAFGESLGASPAAVSGHVLAVGLVLACVPVLAAAQTEIADAGDHEPREVTDAMTPAHLSAGTA
jgi:enterochelin esterase-like enzyme/drug/metabolite transporter (DMT)-like permease